MDLEYGDYDLYSSDIMNDFFMLSSIKPELMYTIRYMQLDRLSDIYGNQHPQAVIKQIMMVIIIIIV